MKKDSPNFVDCETMIDLGFSGLETYWKPSAIVNLIDFIMKKKAKVDRAAIKANEKLETELKSKINQQESTVNQ